MHGRYDALHHHHHHHHAHDHGPDGGHEHGGTGHNHGPGRPVQWQTPHRDDDAHDHAPVNDDARDLDLVLIDAGDPWGGGRMAPGGRLREPIDGLGHCGRIAPHAMIGRHQAAIMSYKARPLKY